MRSRTPGAWLTLQPDNISAPISKHSPGNIRRVFSRHPSLPVGIDGRGRVIAPACHSVPRRELGIPAKSVFRLVSGTGDLNSANARVIDWDKSGARVIIRSNKGEDNASPLLGVHGDGRMKQVGTRFGNNSLCDQAGREKCAVNLRIEGEIFGYDPPYTLSSRICELSVDHSRPEE